MSQKQAAHWPQKVTPWTLAGLGVGFSWFKDPKPRAWGKHQWIRVKEVHLKTTNSCWWLKSCSTWGVENACKLWRKNCQTSTGWPDFFHPNMFFIPTKRGGNPSFFARKGFVAMQTVCMWPWTPGASFQLPKFDRRSRLFDGTCHPLVDGCWWHPY